MIDFKVAKRLDLNCFHHIKTEENCDIINVLANTTDVILLQYVSISNQHSVNLKLTHFFKKEILIPTQKKASQKDKTAKVKKGMKLTCKDAQYH